MYIYIVCSVLHSAFIHNFHTLIFYANNHMSLTKNTKTDMLKKDTQNTDSMISKAHAVSTIFCSSQREH